MPYRISTWTSRMHRRPGVLSPPTDLDCYRLPVSLPCGWLDASQADPLLKRQYIYCIRIAST
jgi:hypothetical protein